MAERARAFKRRTIERSLRRCAHWFRGAAERWTPDQILRCHRVSLTTMIFVRSSFSSV